MKAKTKKAVKSASASLVPYLAQDADINAVNALLAKLGLDAEEAKADEQAEDEDEDEDKQSDAEDEDEDDQAEDEESDVDQKSDAEDEEEKLDAEDEDGDDDEKVSKGAMDAAIKSAALAAEKRAVKRVEALYQAREKVKPLVGKVGMDSASDVYAYALKQQGVNIKGVHPSAYPAMVDMLLSAGKPAKKSQAMDAAAKATKENPLLQRFKQA